MQVSEASIRNSKLPVGVVATDTFTPVSHSSALTLLEDGLERANLEIDHDIKKSFTVTNEGARLFASMTLKSRINDDVAMKVGLTNSYDRSLSMKIGFGSHVFVCSNGCFAADVSMRRKHTSTILDDISDRMKGLFDNFLVFRDTQRLFFDSLADIKLDNKDANNLIVKAAQRNAITGGEVMKVVEQWETPRFKDFQPRNAWSLHNAFTEVYKSGAGTGGVAHRNGVQFIDRSTTMSRVLQEELSIVLPELVGVN